MESLGVSGPSSSNSEDEADHTPAPDSSRHTTHTGKQSALCGLGYGFGVAWKHLRPFLPFFLISFMVVALVYLMQHIIYGGPFKDPLFFVKFNERWPRPSHKQDALFPTKVFLPVPSSESPKDNGTVWGLWVTKLLFGNCVCVCVCYIYIYIYTYGGRLEKL